MPSTLLSLSNHTTQVLETVTFAVALLQPPARQHCRDRGQGSRSGAPTSTNKEGDLDLISVGAELSRWKFRKEVGWRGVRQYP